MTNITPAGNDRPGRVFFLAGEQSGDLHGSLVIGHLKKLLPELKVDGIGGPMMAAAGMNCIHSSDELAVIGFVEVIKTFVIFTGFSPTLENG